MTQAGVPRLGGDRPARWKLTVSAVATLGLVVFVLLLALMGEHIAPQDPNAQDLGLGAVGPTSGHLLGTDDLGRDIVSRVVVGSRTAVVGPILISLGALVVGNALGLLAGYRGGWMEAIIMRWVDVMYSLPGLLVAIVAIGVIGGGYWIAVILLIVVNAPYDTRVIRAATLEQRSLPYVEAAKTIGVPTRRILARHIWPNLAPIVVANSFLNFAYALLALSALSFLGLGVGPGEPDWGRMLAESRSLLFQNPAAALAPGLMIVVTTASMNLLGDRIHEWLTDRGTVL